LLVIVALFGVGLLLLPSQLRDYVNRTQISNPEFDAAAGDLKASLDTLKVPNKGQKDLLAIVESTRPQIVTKR
jgi:hypothetical protein